jgi:hypothetical protein
MMLPLPPASRKLNHTVCPVWGKLKKMFFMLSAVAETKKIDSYHFPQPRKRRKSILITVHDCGI